jgi:mRNA interferase RelE/StbE
VSYSVIIPKRVQKQLDQLSDVLYRRIFEKLKQLEQNPRPVNCKKLVGKQEEYRIRVGDCRIRYNIDDKNKLIILGRCQHRNNVYRDE